MLIAMLFVVSPATAADAADAEHGKKLYTGKCGGCHDTRVHTRPNRIVHTYDDLVNRVRFCDTNAKTNFTDKDILDVSEYLNNEFYKFLKIDS
jgi:mono/diheme cytochrome c family protein